MLPCRYKYRGRFYILPYINLIGTQYVIYTIYLCTHRQNIDMSQLSDPRSMIFILRQNKQIPLY